MNRRDFVASAAVIVAAARLGLVLAVRTVLANGLGVLGLNAQEQM